MLLVFNGGNGGFDEEKGAIIFFFETIFLVNSLKKFHSKRKKKVWNIGNYLKLIKKIISIIIL